MNYSKIYDAFIASKSNRVLDGYFETHHIMPKSLGGLNNQSNLIKLTAKEHFLAHRLLAKIHGGKMWAALSYMTRRNVKSAKDVKITSRVYDLARKKDAEYKSVQYNGKNNPFYGKTFTPEQLKKLKGARPSISGANNPSYGKPQSELTKAYIFGVRYKPQYDVDLTLMNRINSLIIETPKKLKDLNKKYSTSQIHKGRAGKEGSKNPNYGNGQAITGAKNPMYGKHHNEETKRKISEKSKRVISCPHCITVGNIANMARWHFDNCKTRKKTGLNATSI
jgi:hypothetical protein